MATVAVGNSGADSFTVTVAESAAWLTVSQAGSTTPLTLTFTADPRFLTTGLAFGTEVAITGTSASGTETVTIPVSFSMGEVTETVTQVLSGLRVVKAFRMQEQEARRYEAANDLWMRRSVAVVAHCPGTSTETRRKERRFRS